MLALITRIEKRLMRERHSFNKMLPEMHYIIDEIQEYIDEKIEGKKNDY